MLDPPGRRASARVAAVEFEAVAGLSDGPNRCLAQHPLALQLAVEGIDEGGRPAG